jgi:hypothetical protein
MFQAQAVLLMFTARDRADCDLIGLVEKKAAFFRNLSATRTA